MLTVWRLDGARGVLLAALAVMAGLFVFWRWLTRGKPLKAETPAQQAEVRAIRELEDKGVQNKMASLVILKEGWLTTFVTRAVLFLFNILYRTVFTDLTPGRLAGLHTIHFGHWTLLDLELSTGRRRRRRASRRRVMFLSNYDGSWETYLDDFLENLFQRRRDDLGRRRRVPEAARRADLQVLGAHADGGVARVVSGLSHAHRRQHRQQRPDPEGTAQSS